MSYTKLHLVTHIRGMTKELEHISQVLPRLPVIKDLKKWISENMVIVCDSREKENRHITGSIEQLGGKYEFMGLKTADYAYKVCGTLMTDLLIERKNSLTELAANVTTYRERFERELTRGMEAKSKIILLVENDDINSLIEGKYMSKVNANAFLGTLLTFQERYGIDIQAGIKYQHVGRFIYNRFYYHLREKIKTDGIGDFNGRI